MAIYFKAAVATLTFEKKRFIRQCIVNATLLRFVFVSVSFLRDLGRIGGYEYNGKKIPPNCHLI